MIVSSLGLLLAAFVAFAISTVSGGGAGLLLLPVLAMVLPVAQVPAALSVGSAISSVSRMALFYRSIDWRIVRGFVPAAVPAVGLGAWMLSYIDPRYVQLLIGMFLMSNLPFLWRPVTADLAPAPASIGRLGLIGLAAGFVSGLTGAVGLLFNGFYLRHGLSKQQVVATRAANEIILHLIKLLLYTAFGLLGVRGWLYGGLVGLGAVLATGSVRRWLPHLSEKLFKRLGYAAMVASGIVIAIQAGGDIAAARGIQFSGRLAAHGAEGSLSWGHVSLSVELGLPKGLEIERTVALDELPEGLREHVQSLTQGASGVVVEKVYALGRSYVEVHADHAGTIVEHVL